MLRALVLILAALGVTTIATAARADLDGDAERLAASWTARGATLERLAPIFLERGRARVVDLERPEAKARTEGSGCVTVAILAVRTTELLASEGNEGDAGGHKTLDPAGVPVAPILGASAHPEEDHRTRSAGGAAVISRCGADSFELKRITVEATSPRAAVEILVARSPTALGEISEALPERAAGLLAPRGDPGGPIEPGPIAERIGRAERRARSEGASRVVKTLTRAGVSGVGRIQLKLAEGCHRLDLMAEVPAVVPRRATDLDAEAHVQEGGRLLARDRADVPDARLDFCLGEQTVVDVAFAGASGAAPVTVSDALWTTPSTVPVRWGPRARAGFAGALLKRHAPAPTSDALFETIGIQGVTSVPVAVTPGQCYLASVALIRGDARAIRMAATVGGRVPHDEALERPEGAAIAFCAGVSRSAVIDVDVRGNGPWWALSIWGMGAASF
ncbi:MAG: hypothetical protein ABJE95_18515 [Byssovorax sp.]